MSAGPMFGVHGYFGAMGAMPVALPPRSKPDDDSGIGLAIAVPLVIDALFSASDPSPSYDYGTGAGLDSMGSPL